MKHMIDTHEQPRWWTSRTRKAYGELSGALQRDTSTLRCAYGPHGWVPVNEADPYGSLEDMAVAAWSNKPFRVSNVNHNGAFLGDHYNNLLFRAHHDAAHILSGNGFDLAGEVATAEVQLTLLGKLSADARAVVRMEVVGQALYFNKHGEFPLVDGRQPIAHVTDETVLWWGF